MPPRIDQGELFPIKNTRVDDIVRTKTLLLACILAIGVGLRGFVLYYTPAHPNYSSNPYTDEIHYRQLAENLLSFKQYAAYSQGFFSVSTRPPVYPALLSLATILTGFSPRAHQYLNLLLEIGNILLMFALGRWLAGGRWGLAAAAIYALFGPAFVYLRTSTAEILAVTLLLSTTLHLLYFRAGAALSHAFGVAVCYALLIHARPVFLLLIPVVAVAIFWRRSRIADGTHPPRRIRHLTVFEQAPSSLSKLAAPIVLICLFCVPWMARNYRHHRTIVPICTLAGWHLGAHARSLAELPVDLMWRYIYDPARRNYREGDYYREATAESVRMGIQHPIATTVTGFIRVIGAWSFDRPYVRCFLPRAYVYPITVRPGLRLPFIDFEGFTYASVAIILLVAIRKRFTMASLATWLDRALPIIVVVVAYALAHIIGIPMTQYRFTIEPLIVLLFLSLIASLVATNRRLSEVEIGRKGQSGVSVSRRMRSEELHAESVCYFGGCRTMATQINSALSLSPMIVAVAAIILYSVLYGCAYGKHPPSVDYPNAVESGVRETLSYSDLRHSQWDDAGRILGHPRAIVCGELKYLATGYRFPGHQIVALPGSGAVAKLFVLKYSRAAAMGVGDLKLNFVEAPRGVTDGDLIRAVGTVTVDPFREMILNVQEFTVIRASP